MIPSISIIIPVYNAASTLKRCIESILKQDYTNFEILLVNDGSSDNSWEIMLELKKQDPRILVLNKPHSGVSASRNYALENANGKYVCFIDSDDYVESNHLSTMYAHNDCDMVISGYFIDILNLDGSLKTSSSQRLPITGIFDVTNGCDQIYSLFEKGKIHINCNKLLHLDLIRKNKIRYKDVPVNEDYLFMIDYLKHSKSIYATSYVTYHWLRVDGGRSGADSIPDNLLDIYQFAYNQTVSLFKDVKLVNQIFYFTFEFIARKYLIAEKQGVINKHKSRVLLDKMFSLHEVKSCWKSHKISSCGEWLTNFLLAHKFYGIYRSFFIE